MLFDTTAIDNSGCKHLPSSLTVVYNKTMFFNSNCVINILFSEYFFLVCYFKKTFIKLVYLINKIKSIELPIT